MISALERATLQAPGDSGAWLRLGRALLQARAVVAATRAVDQALRINPADLQARTLKCETLLHTGDYADARSAALAITALLDLPFDVLDQLGTVLTACGELAAAHQCFARAVELAPDNPHALFNFAASLRANGKLAEAELAFSRVIALKPDDWDSYNARAQLRTQTEANNHVDELLACRPATADSRGQLTLCFTIAKELEDLGEHPRAFEYLQRGNQLRRKTSRYRVASDLEAMAAIREVFSASALHSPAEGCLSTEPIFVLGLPRTGTTLVERITTSHSEVYSAGELNNFAVELVKQATTAADPTSKRALIERSVQLDCKLLGEAYLDSTRPQTANCSHFVDKMPLNYLYIGLIHRALPNAKIVHLTRSPMDACFAIYKTLFNQAYPFSYHLSDLGEYYCAYRLLMEHWEALLPGKILNVSYEALVTAQEHESRRIIEYCGLAWQSACLIFADNESPTATASAAQVRRGIYRTSVDRWRAYADPLQPLYRQLLQAGLNPEQW